MEKKPKNLKLKSLMTGASIVAMLSGGITTSAWGVGVDFNVTADTDLSTEIANGANNAKNVTFKGDHTFEINNAAGGGQAANNNIAGALDTIAANQGILKVSTDSTVTGAVGTDALRINKILVNGANTLTLNHADVYTNGIELNGHNDATIKFNGANSVVHGAITADKSGRGKIIALKNATFNDNIGTSGNKILLFEVDGTAGNNTTIIGQAKKDIELNATTINLKNGGALATLEVIGNNATIRGNIEATNDDEGVLELNNSSTTLEGTIGATKRVGTVTLTGEGATVTSGGNIIVDNFTFANKSAQTLVLRDGDNLTANTGIDNTAGGTSTIHFQGTSTVDGVVGATNGVVADLSGSKNDNPFAGNVTFTNGVAKLSAIKFGANDRSVIIDKANSEFGNVTATESNKGKVQLNENAILTGDFGTTEKHIKQLHTNGDKTLTVQDGKNIFVKEITTNANDEGILTFAGGSTVVAGDSIGGNNRFNQINVNGGNDKTVAISTDSMKIKAIAFGGDGNLDLSGVKDLNVSTTIEGNAGGNAGNLTLGGNTVVTGAVGGTNTLKSITLNGGTHEFKGGEIKLAAAADANVFALKDGAVVTISTANNTLTAKTVTTDAAGTGRFVVKNVDFTVNADIGSSEKALGGVHLENDKTFQVSAADDKRVAYIPVTTATNKEGTLTFEGGTYGSQVGTAEKALKTVAAAANADATFKDMVYSEAFTQTNNVTFEKGVAGSKDATLTVANGKSYTFNDGAVLGSAATGAAADDGDLIFKGDADIQTLKVGADNRLNKIDFQGEGKTIALRKDLVMNATDITFGKNTFTLGGDVTAGSAGQAANLSGSTIKLGANTLTLASTATVDANTKLNFEIVDGEPGKVKGGVLDNSGAAAQVAGGLDKLLQNGVSFSSKTWLEDGQSYVFLKTTGANAADLKNLHDNDGNLDYVFFKGILANFKVQYDSAKLDTVSNDLKFVVDAKKISDVTQNLKITGRSLAVAKQLDGMFKGSTGDARVLGGTMQSAETEEKLQELLNAVTPLDSAKAAMNNINSTMSDRLGEVSHKPMKVSDAGGISAGEGYGAEYGVWAKAFGSRGNQKKYKGEAGYRSTTYGGAIGVDAQVNDNTLVGVGLSYADTTAKYKDSQKGSRDKAKTFAFTAYGAYDWTESLFSRAVFTVGHTKNKIKKVKANGEFASAKPDGMQYSLTALTGYNYKVADNLNIAPVAGLSYARLQNGSYTESGASQGFNQTINVKAQDKVEGILGAELSSNMDFAGGMITPRAHAYLNYDFKNKATKIDATVNGGTAIKADGVKPAKLHFNLGLGLDTKIDNIEFNVGYNANLAKKYVAHSGSIKATWRF